MRFQQHDGVVVEMVEVFPRTGLRQAVYEREEGGEEGRRLGYGVPHPIPPLLFI